MTEKHTPLPWCVADHPRCGASYVNSATGTLGDVATAWSGGEGGLGRANAALIVRSVNAMPDLVKALEEIASTFDDSWRPGSVERRAGDIARAALAKAKNG